VSVPAGGQRGTCELPTRCLHEVTESFAAGVAERVASSYVVIGDHVVRGHLAEAVRRLLLKIGCEQASARYESKHLSELQVLREFFRCGHIVTREERIGGAHLFQHASQCALAFPSFRRLLVLGSGNR
jgi:hypothetical protein